ncbi:hypothetical protein CDAR_552341 [Caerostris darwini]|uniref:Uncharacterized protein n=1 Tax=Caerostris darwini TaxID=1538125 RepID=A0AAV4NN60_9ARAC|nr:hypothetical protein CDAR_552341 [Caerostris darwini]
MRYANARNVRGERGNEDWKPGKLPSAFNNRIDPSSSFSHSHYIRAVLSLPRNPESCSHHVGHGRAFFITMVAADLVRKSPSTPLSTSHSTTLFL